VASICFLQSLEKKKNTTPQTTPQTIPQFLQTTPQASNQKKLKTQHPLTNPEIFSPGRQRPGRDFAVAAPRAEGTERWQLRCPQEGGGTVPRRAGGHLRFPAGLIFLFKMYSTKRDDTSV